MKRISSCLLIIGLLAFSVFAQDADVRAGAMASQLCGPVQVVETSVAYAVKGMAVKEGCSEVHGRETSPSQWFIYGVKLGTTAPAYLGNGSPDICGPKTFGDSLFDVRIKEIVEIAGCTELHLLTVSPTQWTAFGVRLN